MRGAQIDLRGQAHIVLIGPPGARVDEIGQWIANQLGCAFYSGEELLAERYGRPVGELVVEWSSEQYVAAQVDVNEEALARPGAWVYAAPSGVVDHMQARELLRKHCTVFIDADLATSFPHTGLNAPRPVGLVAPRALWAALLEERRPRYEQAARHIVPAPDGEISQWAQRYLNIH